MPLTICTVLISIFSQDDTGEDSGRGVIEPPARLNEGGVVVLETDDTLTPLDEGDSEKPLDWGGREGEDDELDYRSENYDFEIDQETMDDRTPSKEFSWMKSLTPLGSLSSETTGQLHQQVKSRNSMSESITETDQAMKRTRKQTRLLKIPTEIFANLDKIPNKIAAIELDDVPQRGINITKMGGDNCGLKESRSVSPYPDISLSDMDASVANIYRDIDIMTPSGTPSGTASGTPSGTPSRGPSKEHTDQSHTNIIRTHINKNEKTGTVIWV